MARIEPFRGVRPRKDLAEKVASPPYDVLNSQEAREMVADNPLSFLHVVKPEVDLPADTDMYSDIVYEKAQQNFSQLQKSGTLIQDPQKCFYLYKQIWGDHIQVGLVAGASCQDYQDDFIKSMNSPEKKKKKTVSVTLKP